ncbi:Na+/H+ antiporter subunit E [Candidatus Izimaplasma bacterium ZiA1]|uniref:Na+/H+ antiporter subunit E n=1 Tax=Candidatus Izimoplasma sp. ZiA1 TaxID=2024899 RepID=UPI001F0A8A09
MKYVATFLVLFASYVLLAGLHVQELVVGSIVSLMLTVLIANMVDYKVDFKLPIRLLVFIFVYVPVFVYQLVLANLDVARRVLSPKIPLNPGFVKIKTDLKGDFAKLTLANSITLTPGTLSIDVDGDDMYIHTVDVKGKSPEENKKNISSLFEKILGVVFK